MESIINNPGLQHLAESIFDNLNFDDLEVCRGINKSAKQILDYQMEKPIFLLRKFRGLSKENQKDWTKEIQLTNISQKITAIVSYLHWNLTKGATVDLPCYTSPAVQDDFIKRIWESCEKEESSDEDMEIVKILAPLTDNPYAPDKDGTNMIHWAAGYGHTEIVKILAPLTDNPNAPNNN